MIITVSDDDGAVLTSHNAPGFNPKVGPIDARVDTLLSSFDLLQCEKCSLWFDELLDSGKNGFEDVCKSCLP